MKILWVDDERDPEMFIGGSKHLDGKKPDILWAKTPEGAIQLLEDEKIDVISLDHDMGLLTKLDGGDVLNYIDRRCHFDSSYIPPHIFIHTVNPAARTWMRVVARKLNEIYHPA